MPLVQWWDRVFLVAFCNLEIAVQLTELDILILDDLLTECYHCLFLLLCKRTELWNSIITASSTWIFISLKFIVLLIDKRDVAWLADLRLSETRIVTFGSSTTKSAQSPKSEILSNPDGLIGHSDLIELLAATYLRFLVCFTASIHLSADECVCKLRLITFRVIGGNLTETANWWIFWIFWSRFAWNIIFLFVLLSNNIVLGWLVRLKTVLGFFLVVEIIGFIGVSLTE